MQTPKPFRTPRSALRIQFLAFPALLLSTLLLQPSTSFAQGTAFSYQGRLDTNDVPYTGSAEIQATLWNAASAGSQIAANTPAIISVEVVNGLFLLPLEFGASFNGADRWLQLEVRSSLGAFTPLSPRQPLTPTPYAIHGWTAQTAITVGPGGVTTASFAAGAVDSAAIADTSVSTADLANNAVTSAKISNGAVTAVKLAPSIGVWTQSGNNVYRSSGRVGIGESAPAVPLHVAGGTDTALGGGGYLVMGSLTGENISMDNNEIMARNNGNPDTLYLNVDSGPVAIGTASTATDYKVRINGGTNSGAIIFASSTSETQPVLRLDSASGLGSVLRAEHTSSGPTAILVNKANGSHLVCYGGVNGDVLRVFISGIGNIYATSFIELSDRNAKENFQEVDPGAVLEKVANLPISRWNFKEDSETPHIGPMAQDFYAAFGLGPDDKHIATVDADGVALAAIQGLNTKVESGKQKTQSLEQRLEQKETEITELKKRLAALERIILNEKSN
jgi:hypothetical protein